MTYSAAPTAQVLTRTYFSKYELFSVGTNDGLSFRDGISCTNCIGFAFSKLSISSLCCLAVHGFQQAVYEVSEDARLDTEFRRSVKGTSQFGNNLVLNGVITAAADGTASRHTVDVEYYILRTFCLYR